MFLSRLFQTLKSRTTECLFFTTIYLLREVTSPYPDILHVATKTINGTLIKSNIVSDVLETSPKHTCMVSYFDGFGAELGNNIAPKELRYQPHWVRWTGDNSSYYTFMMIGPDEPSQLDPHQREYIHWLVGNIKGDIMLAEKEYIYQYIGPDPQKDTGLHRYVFLVFKQPDGKRSFEEDRLKTERLDPRRSKFSNQDFAEKYKFGAPVAVNWIYSEWGPNKSRVIPPRSAGKGAIDKNNMYSSDYEFGDFSPFHPSNRHELKNDSSESSKS